MIRLLRQSRRHIAMDNHIPRQAASDSLNCTGSSVTHKLILSHLCTTLYNFTATFLLTKLLHCKSRHLEVNLTLRSTSAHLCALHPAPEWQKPSIRYSAWGQNAAPDAWGHAAWAHTSLGFRLPKRPDPNMCRKHQLQIRHLRGLPWTPIGDAHQAQQAILTMCQEGSVHSWVT